MQKILSEKDDEIRSLKNQIKLKSDENTNLRILSQMILDQRSEVPLLLSIDRTILH